MRRKVIPETAYVINICNFILHSNIFRWYKYNKKDDFVLLFLYINIYYLRNSEVNIHTVVVRSNVCGYSGNFK